SPGTPHRNVPWAWLQGVFRRSARRSARRSNTSLPSYASTLDLCPRSSSTRGRPILTTVPESHFAMPGLSFLSRHHCLYHARQLVHCRLARHVVATRLVKAS